MTLNKKQKTIATLNAIVLAGLDEGVELNRMDIVDVFLATNPLKQNEEDKAESASLINDFLSYTRNTQGKPINLFKFYDVHLNSITREEAYKLREIEDNFTNKQLELNGEIFKNTIIEMFVLDKVAEKRLSKH